MFDLALRNLALNNPGSPMTIRFGPGTFQTQGGEGNSHAAAGWVPQSNWRLIGSGMFVTTLQLVKAANSPVTPNKAHQISLIGRTVNPIDNLEISDMTLDANLSRQPIPMGRVFAQIMTCGIVLDHATNIYIRRVRVINFGTHTATFVYGNPPDLSSLECFPIEVHSAAAIPTNLIEDCIVEQPEFSPARESTLIVIFGTGTLRNNYINSEYKNAERYPQLKVKSLVCNGGIATLVTQWPHCLQKGDRILISGSPVTSYNDRFYLDYDPIDYRTLKFTVDQTNPTTCPVGDPNGPVVVVERFTPMPLLGSITRTGAVATLTTKVPHLRKPGDWIRVSGVLVNGSSDPGTPNYNTFIGSFSVTAVTSTTLDYALDSDPTHVPAGPPTGEIWLDRWPSDPSAIKSISVDASYVVTVETWTPHYRIPPIAGATTIPGSMVGILGVLVGGSTDNRYNGFFPVSAYVSPTVLKYQLASPPGTVSGYSIPAEITSHFQGCSCEGSPAPGAIVEGHRLINLGAAGPYHDTGDSDGVICRDNYYRNVVIGLYQNLWPSAYQTNRVIADRNILDMALNGYAAIDFYGQTVVGATFKELIVRGNIIRFADTGETPSTQMSGIASNGVQDLIYWNNILDFNSPFSIYLQDTQNKISFNNQGADGTPQLTWDRGNTVSTYPPHHLFEVVTDIEELMFWL